MSIISKDIQKAIALLNNEEIIAIPTETVYGLAGNIFSQKAINAIFETKQRPHFNPLIVHIAAVEELETIVDSIPEKAKLLADAFWPGPLTLVLKKKAIIPNVITGGKSTVAVRIPNHPTTLELLQHLDFPLAAPSANPFNRISPTSAKHVEDYFGDKIKMVLDGGNCKSGIESTIIGFENNDPIIYRLGATPVEAIEAVIGKIQVKNNSTTPKSNSPSAPGMLARHYAPKTKTVLVGNILEEISKYKNLKVGVLAFQNEVEAENVLFQIILSKSGDYTEAASKLYDALHQLDASNLDIIVAERFPNLDLGKSINDRLERATK